MDVTPVMIENTAVNTAKIYPRSEHTISRAHINSHALKVLYRLKQSGYEAYLVGGGVRDLLLGLEPKDFDVATNASPEQVKQVFRNCRIIGRRFRLAHVHFGYEIIEVATFRSSEEGDRAVNDDGRLLRDNVFGQIEDDVWRRDFTVNALYYNIKDFSIVDYTGGMADHQAGVIRLIGDPVTRYREDPVRMIRAVRFAVKLGFNIETETEKPIFELAHLLNDIPAARLYDEVLKLFLGGKGSQTFEMLRHYGLFGGLFPQTEQCLANEDHHFPRIFIAKALENSDKRVAEGKTIAPYFLLAVFLWESVQTLAKSRIARGENDHVAYQQAANEVLSKQTKRLSIPKRLTQSMREVWLLQLRFDRLIGSRPYRLLSHPRFRAAYDFLVLRAETGTVKTELAEWWTRFQAVSEAEQRKMTRPERKAKAKKKSKQNPAENNK